MGLTDLGLCTMTVAITVALDVLVHSRWRVLVLVLVAE